MASDHVNTCLYPRRDPTTIRAAERCDDTTEEMTMTTPEPVDPIPADDQPHAYVAVKRTHSPYADRPEWARGAFTVPVHDSEEIEHWRRQGYTLIPIGPDGDTGTRAITTPRRVEKADELDEEIRAAAIEVLARTERDAWKASFDLLDGGDGPQAPPFDDAPADHVIMHGIMRQAARDIDALAEAGLLPTGVEWGVADHGEDEPGMLWGRDGEGPARRAVASTVGHTLHRRFVTDWRAVAE